MLRLACFSAALLAAPVYAQDTAAESNDRAPGVISVTSENDLFGGTDRNYTNGLRLERISSADSAFDILKRAGALLPGISVDEHEVRQGVAISHAIFTPEDISSAPPDGEDRPYAGWLALSLTAVSSDEDTQDTIQLNLGIVGPSAGGEFVQVNFHELINGVDPVGWDSQLRDEPGFEIVGQRLQLFEGPSIDSLNVKTDVGLHGGLALGNVRTYAATGVMARIGLGRDSLDGDFGPPRIRPALSGGGVFKPDDGFGGYLFVGADVRAVARDIFLDGNTFRDSPSVRERRPLVGDLQGGIALQYKNAQLAFTYVHRTEQFVQQDGPQRFGAISLSVAL